MSQRDILARLLALAFKESLLIFIHHDFHDLEDFFLNSHLARIIHQFGDIWLASNVESDGFDEGLGIVFVTIYLENRVHLQV